MRNIGLIVLLFILKFSQLHGQRLFDTRHVLEVKFSNSISVSLEDRQGDSNYHPVEIAYFDSIGQEIKIPIQVKTRGHFRKLSSNCAYPPLLLNFSNTNTSHTIFKDQNKLKLVTPCRSDKYVIREYLVYQLYNLLTPKSFKARLVKVQYGDLPTSESLYGIILEEDTHLAKRNNSALIENKIFRPEQTQVTDFLTASVFQYMIGNTDWSVQYLQNIKLIASDTHALPSIVPYDFDHSGLVNAPYAHPAAALELTSVKRKAVSGLLYK